ncbi:MAG: thioredoxin domain-containing protein [Gemmatimonadota bacterium]
MTVAVSCAVVTTGLVVRRELFTPPPVAAAGVPRPVKGWESFQEGGQLLGAANAQIKMVVFSDFQCGFCRKFALETWPEIHAKYGDKVAMVVQHWPLNGHSEAYPAARAAECAGRQGKFEQYSKALFSQSDSIGKKAYGRFAVEAQVPDTIAFSACVAEPGKVAVIERGMAGATTLGLTGTPSIIIDGMLSPSGALSRVTSMLDEALKARESR